jgi:hypothetical protein
MAPVYSKPLSTNRGVAERIQSHVSSFPPPIAFTQSKRASAKHKATDFREFEMRFHPSDKTSKKTKKSVLTFEDGDAEMWCEWREQLDELNRLVLLTTAKQKAKSVVSVLRGKDLALYTTHRSPIEREQAEIVASLERSKSESLLGILSADKILA